MDGGCMHSLSQTESKSINKCLEVVKSINKCLEVGYVLFPITRARKGKLWEHCVETIKILRDAELS